MTVAVALLLATAWQAQAGRVLRTNAIPSVAFVANRGQEPAAVRYYLHTASEAVFLTDRGLVFRRETPTRGATFALDFVDANPVVPVGREPLAGRVHYLMGADPAAWHRNVPTVRQVVYPALWDAIDLVHEIEHDSIKYRMVVRPGGDVDAIKLAWRGVEDLEVDAAGTLRIRTAIGELVDTAPVAYQDVDGERVTVPARFVPLSADPAAGRFVYGFAVDTFDATHPLVIDPGLAWSTLLGGTVASTRDFAQDVAVDAAGNVYVTGETSSSDFPTTLGAYDTVPGGGQDVFVTKLGPSGTSLVYSTYLGGGASDGGHALAVDDQGAVYVVGHTASPDFPTTPGAFVTTPPTSHDVFVAKLDPTGSTLEYSTFLGGISLLGSSQSVSLTDIAIDDGGHAYVTGATSSDAFPTTPGAFDTTFNGSGGHGGDAFVAKLNAQGSDLVYSTFLGSNGDEVAEAIAVDAAGSAHVAGRTYSASFPTTPEAFDPSFNSTSGTDVFVAKLDGSGSGLLWSTFLGGEWSEEAHAIAVDGIGEVYVTGETASSLFPTTAGAFAEEPDLNDWEGFLTVITPDGTALAYSTFLGGTQYEEIRGLDLDGAGGVYLAGQTYSSNFPTTPGAFDTTFNRYGDAFVARIAPDGLGAADLTYSTFLGGSGSDDAASAIAVDTEGAAHVVGWTFSDDFPTTPGAIKTSHPLFDMDAFVAKLATGAASEVCTGGLDEDGDGLADCNDPECCLDQACWGAQGCDAATVGLSWREAELANATVTGATDTVLGSATLDAATLTSGPFAGQGFFRGDVALTLYGTAYTGSWEGLLFEKPSDRRIVLHGAITGELRGTVDGHLMESQEDSGIYDRYVATWEIVRAGATGTAIVLEVTADVSALGASTDEVAISMLQDGIVATSSGDYVGPLPTRMTRVAIASPASPLFGEGFAFLSYDADTGAGEAWAHLDRTAAGVWNVTGALSEPLDGVVTGTFDERRLPRSLTLTVERASLPPVADIEVRPVGPGLVSAGQTVDYLVEYWNWGVLPADDVVVVAQLPTWAEFVSATAGGAYKWDTHEAVWKLGTVAARGHGTLSARVTSFWELPESLRLSVLAMYEHSSPERDYELNPGRLPLFDHAAYLADTPLDVTSFTTLSPEAFAAERAADPALDDLHAYAIESGYEYLGAAVTTTNTGATVLQALLANAASEPVILTRVDDVSFLAEPTPSGLSLFERAGGMTWDAETDVLDQWGTWAIPGSLTTGQCIRNCIIDKVPRAVLKNVSKSFKLLFKGWDCARCFVSKNESKCLKCLAGLGARGQIPVIGDAYELSKCIKCCVSDPECHRCTQDKRDCGKWSPSGDYLDAVHIWRCNTSTGEYDPFATEINCGYTPRRCCVDGEPVFGVCGRIPQICRDGRCLDPAQGDVCGSNSFCEPDQGAICPAKDPNAKSGPPIAGAGEWLSYEVQLENVGAGIAYGVYVTDVLDTHLDETTLDVAPVMNPVDGSQIAPAGEYDPATRTVTWLVGEVGPGGRGRTTLSARVRADAPRGTAIINYATVYFPSVPEVTPTNPVVSIIPLEDCANGIDDDGNGFVDCDDPTCDGTCPEADRCYDGRDNDGDGATDCLDDDCRPCGEDCTNGIDDDGDGLVDCDSPYCDGACAEAGRCNDGRDNDDDGATDCDDGDCRGDPACLGLCDPVAYAKGASQVRFDRKHRATASMRTCVDPALCTLLDTGTSDLAALLNACDPLAASGTSIKANRKRTKFTARSAKGEQPAYVLKVNCAKGEMRLRVKKAAFESCITASCSSGDAECPLRTCLRVSDGSCWCADQAFRSVVKKSGRLTKLKLKSALRCPAPP